MLGAVSLEQKRVSVSNFCEAFLQVQNVRMWWQRGNLLCHLVCVKLLIVVQRAYVYESEETESAGLWVVLK